MSHPRFIYNCENSEYPESGTGSFGEKFLFYHIRYLWLNQPQSETSLGRRGEQSKLQNYLLNQDCECADIVSDTNAAEVRNLWLTDWILCSCSIRSRQQSFLLLINHVSLQNAGNQLKSLQKALKNPIGNAGLLAGELTKRAKRLHHTQTHRNTHAVYLLLSEEQEVFDCWASYALKQYHKRGSAVVQNINVAKHETKKSGSHDGNRQKKLDMWRPLSHVST